MWLVEMGFLEPGGRAGSIEKRMNERRQPVYGDCPLGKPRQQIFQFHYLLPCLLSGLSIGQGHIAACQNNHVGSRVESGGVSDVQHKPPSMMFLTFSGRLGM